MSSELESIVQSLQFNDCLSLVIATAITYDYIITFMREINCIWARPWSSVSTMFIIVRYVGPVVAFWKYVPSWTSHGTILFILSDYAFILFLGAADLVMILRVYAMYGRSKLILGLLVVFYAATIIVYFVSAIYYNNPNTSFSMDTAQVLDMSFCYEVLKTTAKIGKYKPIARLTLAVLLLAFALARICMDSFAAYKETREWRSNQYISLLVGEGVLYFVAHLFNNIKFGEDTPGLWMTTLSFILFFVLSPRFIMSVRELYLQNMLSAAVEGVSQDSGIDSGFGIGKIQSSRTTVLSFGDVGFADMTEEDRDMEMHLVESKGGVGC